jgi:hypothetical protein
MSIKIKALYEQKYILITVVLIIVSVIVFGDWNIFGTRPGKEVLAASDLTAKNQLFYRGTTPFLWIGDTAWFLMHATYQNANTYLANRQQKGFTVIHAGCTGWDGNPNVANDDGVTPFVSGATNVGASRNSAYWTNINNIINSANSKGLYIALLPMNANTAEANAQWLHTEQTAYNYGHYLGSYFKQKNIIWLLGGDSDITYEPLQPLTRALARGIADGNAGLSASLGRTDANRNFNTTLISFHPAGWHSQSSSMVYNNDPWLDFNLIQTNRNHHEVFSMTQKDYALGKTVVMGEGQYFSSRDGTSGGTAYSVRQEAYWSFMAGGYFSYGSMFGYWDKKSTCCHSNVVDTMETPAVDSMVIFIKFLKDRNWYDYKPDQSFIISGASSGATVNAAALNGNKAAMLYLSTSNASVQVNMAKLNSAANVKVSRFNPVTGAISVIGEYPSSGSRTFNTGGLTDAVILFEPVASGFTPVCGDGICNGTETSVSCPADCSTTPPPPSPPTPVCTDNDGDRHIVENNPDFASCGNVCGPGKNQSCQGYNDCNDNNPKIYYGALNICNSGTDESCGKYANTCFCADGTEKNKCAPNPPWQCNSEGVLNENCKVCGCQNLWTCGPFGTYCLPPKPVCGNGVCESELGESCGNCAKDCGRCPTSLTPGSHTITLMAMDARGNMARHSIELNVKSDPGIHKKEDTIWPVVNTFSVMQLQKDVIAGYGVVDRGGSHLNTVEIWRANDNSGKPGAWTKLHTINLAAFNVDAQNNAYTDTPKPGTYWYGLRVSDQAGHCTTEENKDCSTGTPNGAESQGPRKIVVFDPDTMPSNPPTPPGLPSPTGPPAPPILP